MNRKLYHKSGRNVSTVANVDTIEGIARVGTISAYLALSEGGFGPTFYNIATIQGWVLTHIWQSGHYLGQVCIVQGWNWANIDQSCHYPKVNLGQNRARLPLSSMLALSKGGLGPKVVNPRNYRHFQGWIWAKRLPSIPRLQRKFKQIYISSKLKLLIYSYQKIKRP